MHLIFAIRPSLVKSDLILYIVPALTVSILFFKEKPTIKEITAIFLLILSIVLVVIYN